MPLLGFLAAAAGAVVALSDVANPDLWDDCAPEALALLQAQVAVLPRRNVSAAKAVGRLGPAHAVAIPAVSAAPGASLLGGARRELELRTLRLDAGVALGGGGSVLMGLLAMATCLAGCCGALLCLPPRWFAPAAMAEEDRDTPDPLDFVSKAVLCASTEFSRVELVRRYLRALVFFYFLLIVSNTTFIKFFYFFKTYVPPDNCGWKLGLLKTVFVPLHPFMVFCWSLPQMVWPTHWTCKPMQDGVSENTANDIFTRLIHANYMHVGYTVSHFLTGQYGSEMGLRENMSIFSKDFWRAHLREHGATVAPEVGRWKGGALKWTGDFKETDLVIKVEFGSYSVGDGFLEYGKDFKTKDEAAEKITKDRQEMQTSGVLRSSDSLILSRVMPCKTLGVHSIDITTFCGPDGKVRLIWTSMGSAGSTFNSNEAKHYVRIDGQSGRIAGADQWFRSASSQTFDEADIGRLLPGAREACEKAVVMHEALLKTKLKSLFFCSWDVMITDEKGGSVWFEGNSSRSRMNRFIFCDTSVFLACLQSFALPLRKLRLQQRDAGLQSNAVAS